MARDPNKSARDKARRRALNARGLCQRHKDNPVVPGKKMCAVCVERNKAYMRRKRIEWKAGHRCRCCGRRLPPEWDAPKCQRCQHTATLNMRLWRAAWRL